MLHDKPDDIRVVHRPGNQDNEEHTTPRCRAYLPGLHHLPILSPASGPQIPYSSEKSLADSSSISFVTDAAGWTSNVKDPDGDMVSSWVIVEMFEMGWVV